MEFLDLDAKIDKSGTEEIKTLDDKPTILDFKEFNYDNCSLIDCISLLQSVLNSPQLIVKIKRSLNISVTPSMRLYLPRVEARLRGITALKAMSQVR